MAPVQCLPTERQAEPPLHLGLSLHAELSGEGAPCASRTLANTEANMQVHVFENMLWIALAGLGLHSGVD